MSPGYWFIQKQVFSIDLWKAKDTDIAASLNSLKVAFFLFV